MNKSVYIAGVMIGASLFLVTDAHAAKGIKKNRNHAVRGTVVSVNRHGQALGNVGNFGQSGSFVIKTGGYHRKRGFVGNVAMGAGRMHTFQANSSTQFYRQHRGMRTRTHFGSLHHGEHVIVHTNGTMARNVTILSSSRYRGYNRYYGYGVHRRRPYGGYYANYYHHHHHHRPAGLTGPTLPLAANTVAPTANTTVPKTPIASSLAKPAVHQVAHKPASMPNAAKHTAIKVANNKPQVKTHTASHVTHAKPATHVSSASKSHHSSAAHHTSHTHHSSHHSGGRKK